MPAKKKPSRMNARLDWLTKTRASSAVVITGKAEKKSSRDKESNCQHFARKIASCVLLEMITSKKNHTVVVRHSYVECLLSCWSLRRLGE